MPLRLTSQLVVSAILGLSDILLVPGTRCAAATPPGDGSKTETPAKAQNLNKKVRTQPEQVRVGSPEARTDGTGLELKASNPKMAATDALMRALDLEISTKDLPRSFYALLDYLTEK